MLKYIISGIAAINTQVVVLLALRKVGFELSPLNSPLEFVGGCLIGMVLFVAYSICNRESRPILAEYSPKLRKSQYSPANIDKGSRSYPLANITCHKDENKFSQPAKTTMPGLQKPHNSCEKPLMGSKKAKKWGFRRRKPGWA